MAPNKPNKWSGGAVKALKLIEKNRRGDLHGALNAVDGDPGPPECAGRNAAVKARVHVELWRNGFDGADALEKAEAFAQSGLQADKDDFYTNWKMAYTLKYRARSRGWNQEKEVPLYYERALTNLSPDDSSDTDARRSVLIDRGETHVYLSRADVGVDEIKRALDLKGGPKRDWHYWAYAFALHQNGDYMKSVEKIDALLKGEPPDDLYYNDMRLLLAASLARAGKMNEANAAIEKFREIRDKVRDKDKEPVWTIALELERGAFLPGSPGEAHWRASLEMLDPAALPR